MTFGPMHVSNSVLERAFDDGVDVTPMRLQRLLFFAACEYAKDARAPLLYESFQAWEYGPVIRSVHDKFKPFAGRPIHAFARDAAGNRHRPPDARANPIFEAAVDRVWRQARDVSAVDLSRIALLAGSAWNRTSRAGELWISDQAIANDVTYLTPLGLIRTGQPSPTNRRARA